MRLLLQKVGHTHAVAVSPTRQPGAYGYHLVGLSSGSSVGGDGLDVERHVGKRGWQAFSVETRPIQKPRPKREEAARELAQTPLELAGARRRPKSSENPPKSVEKTQNPAKCTEKPPKEPEVPRETAPNIADLILEFKGIRKDFGKRPFLEVGRRVTTNLPMQLSCPAVGSYIVSISA